MCENSGDGQSIPFRLDGFGGSVDVSRVMSKMMCFACMRRRQSSETLSTATLYVDGDRSLFIYHGKCEGF